MSHLIRINEEKKKNKLNGQEQKKHDMIKKLRPNPKLAIIFFSKRIVVIAFYQG